MNNRNQNQRTLIPSPPPAAAPAATYLNVFTVEEYESNGKPKRNGPGSAPPSRIRKVRAFPSN